MNINLKYRYNCMCLSARKLLPMKNISNGNNSEGMTIFRRSDNDSEGMTVVRNE